MPIKISTHPPSVSTLLLNDPSFDPIIAPPIDPAKQSAAVMTPAPIASGQIVSPAIEKLAPTARASIDVATAIVISARLFVGSLVYAQPSSLQKDSRIMLPPTKASRAKAIQ